MENTSGQGSRAAVPGEISGWNWGAFLLNWIWGIGNNTFVAFLMFVPLVNFVMMFVLGAKGNAWAWRNKRWHSVEQFKATQRSWTKGALVAYASIAVLFVAIFFAVSASMKSSEAFELAMRRLESSQEAAQMLGKPISSGMPMGSIQIAGPSGSAKVSFGVSGPNGKGTVYLNATKDLGRWRIDEMALEQEGTGQRINLRQ